MAGVRRACQAQCWPAAHLSCWFKLSPVDALIDLEASLALPHERDQSLGKTDAQPGPPVQQASRDLRRGLQDTGESAPMDKAYDRLKR